MAMDSKAVRLELIKTCFHIEFELGDLYLLYFYLSVSVSVFTVPLIQRKRCLLKPL